MIYLFCGDDSAKKISNYQKFLAGIPKDTEVLNIGKNDFDESQVESLYRGAGLFTSKSVVIFVNIFEKENAREFVLNKLGEMQSSPNTFVFVEGKLLKSVLDKFKKVEAKINNFELTHAQRERFNNFLLADAFSARDKLNLWIYFRQAMDKGVGMEELTGVLFWKIKDMLLKKNFGKWKAAELKSIGAKLSYLLPDARKNSRDAEAVFEAFLLEAF